MDEKGSFWNWKEMEVMVGGRDTSWSLWSQTRLPSLRTPLLVEKGPLLFPQTVQAVVLLLGRIAYKTPMASLPCAVYYTHHLCVVLERSRIA